MSDTPPTTAPGHRFLVRGHVQGVGFRWWARGEAKRLGLAGSVRNLPDGGVEVRATGAEPALAELRALLAEGPPGARVERVEEAPDPAVPAASFDIAR